LEAGKLDRALRVLRYADRLCPTGAAASRPLLGEVEQALGSPAVDAVALVDRGLAELGRGRTSNAQRAFDRAMVSLERRFNEPFRIEISNGFGPLGALPWRPNGAMQYRSTRSLGPAIASSADGALLAVNDGAQIVVLDRKFRERMRLVGHGSEVTSAAFSADGRRLLSGGYDKRVRVWDLETGDSEFEVPVQDAVRSVHWLEDEQAVAACAGAVASVWAYPGGDHIADVQATTTLPAAIEITRFGLALFASDQGRISVHQLPGGEPIGELAQSDAVAVSRSGAILAAYRKGAIELWSMPERKLATRLSLPPDTEADLSIFGERLLVAGRTGLLRLWRLPRGERLADVTVNDYGWLMGMRRDGALALRDGNAVRYVDPQSGRDLERIEFEGAVQPLAMALEGDALLALGPDNDNAFTFWKALGEPLATLGAVHAATVRAVALSAKRGLVALALYDKAVVLDAHSGRLTTLDLPANTHALKFVRNGAELVSMDSAGLSRWDLSGKRVRVLPRIAVQGTVSDVSADGSTALIHSSTSTLSLWDIPANRLRVRIDGKLRSHAVLSADGARAAWIADDGSFQVWGGRPLRKLASGGHSVTALAMSASGNALAVAEDGAVRIWDVGNRRARRDGLQLSGQIPGALQLSGSRVYALATDVDAAPRPWLLDFERKTSVPLENHLDIAPGQIAVDGGITAVVSSSQRSVSLYDDLGRAVAVLRATPDARTAYALGRSGWLDAFGDPAPLSSLARCRIGHRSFPLAVCAERLQEHGRLAHVLRSRPGDPPP
jgi:WD40 repeat protein